MKLTTVREIYKNREAFLDKEVTSLKRFRSYTMIKWQTLTKSPS